MPPRLSTNKLYQLILNYFSSLIVGFIISKVFFKEKLAQAACVRHACAMRACVRHA